jgi:RNA polymerase sigma-70 factor (ECF subfamily)
MADESSFAAVLARLRHKDNEAAAGVFERFAGRLLALARRHLPPRLLQKVDPDDVLQSAFGTGSTHFKSFRLLGFVA